MRLLKCYIENFGKLRKYSYNFQNGLNVIKEENGYGKTTLAIFIKSMFYGLDANKSEKSERKKYKPWQGGEYGGNLEFEIGSKRYRVERFFGNKQSDDTFKLYNLDTNLESNDYSENIGEEIFKINKSGYERSTYIPQGEIQVEMEDSINAKLGNILESDNDVNTSEEAIKILSDAMKQYIKIGNKGLINEKKERINELKRKIENSKFDEINIENKKKRIYDIKEKIKINEEKRDKVIEKERKQAKLETYNNIINNLNDEQKRYNELNEFFNGNIPEDDKIQEMNLKAIEIEKCQVEINNSDLSDDEKETYEVLKNKFDGKKLTEDIIDEQISNYTKMQETENKIQIEEKNQVTLNEKVKELQNVKEKNKKKDITILIISSIICIIACITGIANSLKVIGVILFIIGLIGIIYSAIKLKDNKLIEEFKKIKIELENSEKNLEELEYNRDKMNNSINKVLELFEENNSNSDKIMMLTNLKTEFNSYRTLENKKISKENIKQGHIVKQKNMENDLVTELKNYFETTDYNLYSEQIGLLKLNKDKLKQVIQEIEKTDQIKKEFENENDISSLKIENTEELNKEELNVNIDRLSDEKNQLKNEIEYLENKIDENEEIETDIEKLNEEIEYMQKKYNIIEKTKEFLETAKKDFSSSYLKEMVDGFKLYLKLIDDSNPINTSVDVNLDIKIDVNGAKREVKYFSAGYKDLIYICMRFSLIKALFKEELPFVILDDPFVNLDDGKTKKAIDLVNKLSKEYQIIYFVCNQSRT